MTHYLYTTKVNLKNEGYLYSACSNPTNDGLSDCFTDFAPINFGGLNIKHPCLLSYPRQSQKT